MPRGKDAPAITGGQIDPYVASTMQQSKQQAENRLLTAMQERGATQRAGIAASAQLGAQKMRSETQLQVSAAQSEADDKRAAEAERGQREDKEYATMMQKSTQEFQAKQATLDREHRIAMTKGDREYAEKIRDKQDALRRFEIEKQTFAQERSTNAILSVLKGSMQRETGREKALTVLSEEADKFDKDKEIYERTKTRVIKKVFSDRRLDLPIVGKIVKSRTVSRGREEYLYPGTQADPMGVLQDQLDSNQANVSVEQLAPEKINELEDAVQNGTTSAEDIRSTLGVLEGMMVVVEQKRKDNPLKTDETAYDFWNNSYQNIIDMRNAVEGLANSHKKIKDSDTETVGSRVQYALGVIRNNSLGGRASRLKELTRGDFGAVFEEMTKSFEPYQPYEITAEMTPYEIEIREEENMMLERLRPNIGGVE